MGNLLYNTTYVPVFRYAALQVIIERADLIVRGRKSLNQVVRRDHIPAIQKEKKRSLWLMRRDHIPAIQKEKKHSLWLTDMSYAVYGVKTATLSSFLLWRLSLCLREGLPCLFGSCIMLTCAQARVHAVSNFQEGLCSSHFLREHQPKSGEVPMVPSHLPI